MLCINSTYTEHFNGHDGRNSSHKIAIQELLMECHWLWLISKLIYVTHLKYISF